MKNTVSNTRFNPARAGNIGLRKKQSTKKKVQPRPCGEYDNGRILKCDGTGSTPPVRGISFLRFEMSLHGGFNPARAGNILNQKSTKSQNQVQPRPCGEYTRRVNNEILCVGSTPPVRGIFQNYSARICYVGFNPARAGNI